jgi:hypothetical protein
MSSKLAWALCSLMFVTSLYYLPGSSLVFLQRWLEVMVIVHLGLEVLKKMQQG